MSTRQKLVTHSLIRANRKDSVDDTDDTRMTILSPGMYGCHQFTAMEQQQMAYLKLGLKTFNHPNTQPFSDPVRRLNHISERGPYTVQYNGPLPYPDQSRVVENYRSEST